MAAEAATIVASGLPEYELVVVVTPEGGEEAFEARIAAVSKLVTGRGGTIINTDRWGKRKLASPVKHHREGLYFLVRFNADTQLGKELDAHLRMSEDVLRHMLVRLEAPRKVKVKEPKRRPQVAIKETGTGAAAKEG